MKEQDVSLDGVSLHTATWGDPSPERAVLVIHGLTASGHYWTDLGPVLAEEGWFVVAPDLRGRGLSSKPPHGYGVPYHAADLLALCDAFGLATVHLVGHSLGALVAMFLAGLHGGRIGKVVLVDAGGKLPPDTLRAIALSLSRLDTVYPSLDAYLGTMKQAPIYRWGPFWEQYFRYDAEVRPDGTVRSRVSRRVVDEENAVNALTVRLEALPDYIRRPTLVVRAALGTLGPDRGLVLPPEEAERLRSVIPDCRVLEVPGTNHYTVPLSDLFKRELIGFLEEPLTP